MNYIWVLFICLVLASTIENVRGQGGFLPMVEQRSSMGGAVLGFVTGIAVGRASAILEEDGEEEEEEEEDDPCRDFDCGEGGECIPNEESEEEAECLCKEGFCGPNCSPLSVSANEMCPSGVCQTFGSTCIDGECFCNCSRKLVDIMINDITSDICAPECEFSNTYRESQTDRVSLLGLAAVTVDGSDSRTPAVQCQDACNSNPDCAAVTLSNDQMECALLPMALNQVTLTTSLGEPQTYFERICN